jgi:hypothetical protein
MATTSVAIALSAGGRVKITDAVGSNYYSIASVAGIRPDVAKDEVIIEFFAGGDKLRALRLNNDDITSPAGANAQARCDALDALLPIV